MYHIKTIIIDDEKSAQKEISNLLKRHEQQFEILAICSNLSQGVEAINNLNPDVVFLDIQMPNFSGLEIKDFFDEVNFEIIFVTAHDQFAVSAFKVNALDYLVKPINRNRLNEAIDKLKEKLKIKKELEEYRNIKNLYPVTVEKKITIYKGGIKQIIITNEIVAFEANGSYCKVHFTKGPDSLMSKNLKYYSDIVADLSHFKKIHRGWLINTNHIIGAKKSELKLYLTNSVEARIARAKLKELDFPNA